MTSAFGVEHEISKALSLKPLSPRALQAKRKYKAKVIADQHARTAKEIEQFYGANTPAWLKRNVAAAR